jgi:putative ABC transport system permease protein
VIISEEIFKKYFEGENVIGHQIKIQLNNEWKDFAISGVVETPPSYSSLKFDFLLPLTQHPDVRAGIENDWGRFFFTSFLKVSPEKIPHLKEGMPAFILKHMPDARNPDGTVSMNFALHPFRDHHLSEGFSGGGLIEGRSIKSLLVFIGIAAVILLLACLNFMNLTTAQSSKRVVEIGIRKVVGAAKSQLIPQFLFESFLISAFASIVALGIAELSLLIFRNLLGADLSVFSKNNTELYIGLAAVTTLTGLLAGIYPALVLSNLPTPQTFKRYFKIGGSNLITRSLLSFQFCLSIILIVCALVMWKQQRYLMNKDLGFNEEQILVIPFKPSDSSSLSLIKNELAKYPEVINTSKTSGAFTRGNNATLHTMPDKSRTFLYMQSIDEDYIETMQMKVVHGKSFGETGNAPDMLMVNEALLKQLNLTDSIGVPLGQSIGFVEHPTIVGVVKNFHHAQLKHEISPIILFYNKPFDRSYLMIRLAQNEIAAGLKKVETLWERVNPDSPFEYSFLDEDIQKQYEQEQRWSKIITLATAMAIFLSILGLLGLAMFTAEKRKKEVGIRKVLGASVRQLFFLLSKTYLWLILTSFLIAAPAAYYIVNKYWLENFVYRINIDVSTYLVALVAVFSIAFIAIGSQVLRAAFQNPADTLKEE